MRFNIHARLPAAPSPTCSAATETGSASSQVLSAAQTLSADSGRLKTEVSKFLTNVRAA
jgi:hypothetical protein